MSGCVLCGNLRPFEERDREELDVMHVDLLQSVAKMKAHIHAGHGRTAYYRCLEGLERDIAAIRDRIETDGFQTFEVEVPY